MKKSKKIILYGSLLLVVLFSSYIYIGTLQRNDSTPLSCPYYMSGPLYYGRMPVIFKQWASTILTDFKEGGEVIMYLPNNIYPVPKDKKIVKTGDFTLLVLDNITMDQMVYKKIRFNSGKKGKAWVFKDLFAINNWGTVYGLDMKCTQEDKEFMCKIICKLNNETRALYAFERCKCES